MSLDFYRTEILPPDRHKWTDEELEVYNSTPNKALVKYTCPCGNKRLTIYYVAHNHETRINCPNCGFDTAVHNRIG